MATMTLKTAGAERVERIGRFAVGFVASNAEMPWVVFDQDGDWTDAFETRDEAVEVAEEWEDEAAEEDRQDTLAALREQLAEAMDDCDDPAKLQAALAVLGW